VAENSINDSDALLTRINSWLERAVTSGASDLHLIPDYPPVLRLHGDLKDLDEPVLDEQIVQRLIAAYCNADLAKQFQVSRNVDFSFEVALLGRMNRFRTNLFYTDELPAACLRVVPPTIPDFDWAGFPLDLAERLAGLRDGLVILTGMTGSGKTTSLAMVVERINQAGGRRIITVEQPVEYRFSQAKNSVVTQREVGTDVLSFADGLRSGLRQDPDVILVGEIRDRETAQMALSAAETGHLVFSSLHTRDTKGAISRFADFFPQDFQNDIRSQLAIGLQAIICQRLLPDVIPGTKRHLALEILWNTVPVASGIRQGKLESIDNCLITRRNEGMLSFDESVRQLFASGYITREVAEQNIVDPSRLKGSTSILRK
jgi:twitching motility protein PilT